MSKPSGKLGVTVAALLTMQALASADPPEPKAKLEHDGPVNCIAFSPDGKLLAAGDRAGTIRLWDVKTGKVVHRMLVEESEILALSFAPDGKTLAATDSGGWVRLWDVGKGTQIREFRAEGRYFWSFVAYAGDGRTLVAGHRSNCLLTFWDSQTAKETYRFPAIEGAPLRTSGTLHGLALLPNGKMVVALTGPAWPRARRLGQEVSVPTPPRLRLLSVVTGKELYDSALDGGDHMALSADGKTVAVSQNSALNRGRLMLHELATGHQRAVYADPAAALAFSPDGRFLATADPKEHLIAVRNLVTGKLAVRLEGHEADVSGLAFSPDGRLLASASGDFSILLWDTTAWARRQLVEIKLSEAELLAGWEQFAGSEAAKAYQFRNQLLQTPGQAIPFLRAKLEAVSLFDPKRLTQLIGDLDSKQFNIRQQASAELEQLGAQAEAALQKVLEGKPPLETRRRVEDLLQRIGSPNLGPEQLRVHRAVEVLEAAGMPEARAVLEHFAKPEPPSFLTLEARMALKRLARLQAKP